MKYACMLVSLAALCHTAADAEITPWQIGGSGLNWAESDSVSILVDKASGALQPVYIRPDRSVFSYLENWGSWNPRELGYVDGDTNSYNAPSSGGSPDGRTYTFDLAVPVPFSHSGSTRLRRVTARTARPCART